jgi:hypothetical protein
MRIWQPTLFNRKVRARTVSIFQTGGKRSTTARHVRRHSTGVRSTSRKFSFGGDLFDIKKGVAKRRGLL